MKPNIKRDYIRERFDATEDRRRNLWESMKLFPGDYVALLKAYPKTTIASTLATLGLAWKLADAYETDKEQRSRYIPSIRSEILIKDPTKPSYEEVELANLKNI